MFKRLSLCLLFILCVAPICNGQVEIFETETFEVSNGSFYPGPEDFGDALVAEWELYYLLDSCWYKLEIWIEPCDEHGLKTGDAVLMHQEIKTDIVLWFGVENAWSDPHAGSIVDDGKSYMFYFSLFQKLYHDDPWPNVPVAYAEDWSSLGGF